MTQEVVFIPRAAGSGDYQGQQYTAEQCAAWRVAEGSGFDLKADHYRAESARTPGISRSWRGISQHHSLVGY